MTYTDIKQPCFGKEKTDVKAKKEWKHKQAKRKNVIQGEGKDCHFLPIVVVVLHHVKTSGLLVESRFRNSYVVIIVVADIDMEIHRGPNPL